MSDLFQMAAQLAMFLILVSLVFGKSFQLFGGRRLLPPNYDPAA